VYRCTRGTITNTNSRINARLALPAAVVRQRRQGGVIVMNSTSKALTIHDGFDDTGDTTASPLRGIAFKFKDGSYYAYSDPFPTYDRTFVVIDTADGWQKLAEGMPPEYLMRQPGQVRPPRPHVDEKDWPMDFNGRPAHPWKLTRYLYLLDTKTGEVSTFWSDTIGGKVAFDQLSQQVKVTRGAMPGAVPVIALESALMPTQYGSKKPRPHFRIAGYKLRGDIGSQNLLTDETKTPFIEVQQPSLADEMNDDLPGDLAPPKPVKASAKKPKGV
jgi:hypothetical protein